MHTQYPLYSSYLLMEYLVWNEKIRLTTTVICCLTQDSKKVDYWKIHQNTTQCTLLTFRVKILVIKDSSLQKCCSSLKTSLEACYVSLGNHSAICCSLQPEQPLLTVCNSGVNTSCFRGNCSSLVLNGLCCGRVISLENFIPF